MLDDKEKLIPLDQETFDVNAVRVKKGFLIGFILTASSLVI